MSQTYYISFLGLVICTCMLFNHHGADWSSSKPRDKLPKNHRRTEEFVDPPIIGISGARDDSWPRRRGLRNHDGQHPHSRFPRGQVSSLLFDQSIDGQARHFLGRDLVGKLLPQTDDGTLALFLSVGWGGRDPVIFPTKVPKQLRVEIFEPLPQLAKSWEQTDKHAFTSEEQGRIHYHDFGLGAEAATIPLRGVGLNYVGRVEPGAEHIHDHISMLSIDTQGTEFTILQGLEDVLVKHGCDIMLIEALGSTQDVGDMLVWLDNLGYVIFDFVPIKSCSYKGQEDLCDEGNPGSLWGYMDQSWYMSEPRPSEFKAWATWLNSAGNVYSVVQTDILAVHRSFITPKVISDLEHLCVEPAEPDSAPAISKKCPLATNKHRSSATIFKSPRVMPECTADDIYACID